jgi:hypothetical protein
MTRGAWEDDGGALGYWRLAEELSISQIAWLMLGCDPEEHSRNNKSAPKGYSALLSSLCAAVRRESVEAVPVYYQRQVASYGNNSDVSEDDPTNMNVQDTVIDIESLIRWLKSRGHTSGFFFGGEGSVEPYLDPDNGRYPPKLAAAVKAWIAVGDASTSQTPKQQIAKWLRENAVDFDLTDDDGNPIETAIEDIAKVANWSPKGGAPKTKIEPPQIPRKPMRKPPPPPPVRRSFAADLEDDIPF